MIIKKACKFCGKTTDITSEIKLDNGTLLIFACGHSYIEESLSSPISDAPIIVGEAVPPPPKTLFEQLEEAVPEWCEEHQRNCIKTISSKTGKHLFPYQQKGAIFATKANAKCIFADEMGLGKTIQGLVTILLNQEKLLPAIFICKSIAKTNWLWETIDWLGIPAQVITSSSETPFDMFKIHIASHDMINRLNKMFKFSDMKAEVECPVCHYRCDEGKHEKCPECAKIKTEGHAGDVESKQEIKDGKLITITKHTQISKSERNLEVPTLVPYFDKSIGSGSTLRDANRVAWWKMIERCKTIIIDESHLIKNPESQRSKAVKVICSRVPHVIGMSGTLIKNNATELFQILNIVKPEKFWRFQSFCQNYVRFEYVKTAIGWSQKYTGLKDPESFKWMTRDYMIRRTTDEVLPELPKLFKQQKYVELDDKFREIYDDSEKDFAKWFDNASSVEIRTNLLAQLALLRHQTSLMKVDFTIDLVMEFLMSCNRKIAIFTHHIDSREMIASRLDDFFKKTNAELGDEVYPSVFVLGRGADVQEEIEAFKNSNSRVIVLSTLSHGESINLQFISDSILHERQWNPANEDQAISGRFRRIGQQAEHVNCMIPVALGTIDEYFVQIVEHKRGLSKELDEGQQEAWNAGFVAELAEKIAQKGREKWRL